MSRTTVTRPPRQRGPRARAAAAASSEASRRGSLAASSRAGTTTWTTSIDRLTGAGPASRARRRAPGSRRRGPGRSRSAAAGARPRSARCTSSASSTQPVDLVPPVAQHDHPAGGERAPRSGRRGRQLGRAQEVADLGDHHEVEAPGPAAIVRVRRARARSPGRPRRTVAARPRAAATDCRRRPPVAARRPGPRRARRSSSPPRGRAGTRRAAASPATRSRLRCSYQRASVAPRVRLARRAAGRGVVGAVGRACAGSARGRPRSGPAAPAPAASRRRRASDSGSDLGGVRGHGRALARARRLVQRRAGEAGSRAPRRAGPSARTRSGNSHRSAPVRRAAAAAARPAASWSGCPSRRQGATTTVPRAVADELDQAGGELVLRARPRHRPASPSWCTRRPGTPSARGRLRLARSPGARSSGVVVGESGWLPSPVGGRDDVDLDPPPRPRWRSGHRRRGSRRRGAPPRRPAASTPSSASGSAAAHIGCRRQTPARRAGADVGERRLRGSPPGPRPVARRSSERPRAAASRSAWCCRT